MEPQEKSEIQPEGLQPGTKIGPYEIVKLVGVGGFGALYKVQRAGRTYALKLSRFKLANLDAEDREHQEERADREVAALKSLRHPNIVRTHANDQWPEPEDGFPYIVMDFVEGARLYDWRRQTSPSLNRICITFEKIAGAVDYMHRLGLYHRDLKSENILIRASDGEPIIVDFGIARPRMAYTVTRAQNTVGTIAHYTPEYIQHLDSPEFLRGALFEWRATTDLHSIGYLLYETLVGRPPFPLPREAGREAEVLRAIKLVTPTAPSQRTNGRVPGSLDRIVLKLLEKNPEDRYQSGREVAEALAAAREAGDASWEAPFDVPAVLSPSQATPVARRGAGPAEKTQPQPARAGDVGVAPVFADPAGEVASAPGAPPNGQAEPVVPRPNEGFNPPTVVRSVFKSVDAPAPSRVSTTGGPRVPTAIRQGQELLAKSEPKRKPPYLVLGGLGIIALMLLFFLFAASSAPKQVRPENLLAAEREQEKKEQAAAGALQPAQPSPIQVSGTLPPPVADEGPHATGQPAAAAGTDPRAPAAAPAPPALARRGKGDDASSIDDELAHEFGRPTVPGPDKGHTTRSSKSTDPLMRSARLDPLPVAKGTRGVPMGSHIHARLLTNLDSRTIADGPVEAMVTAPFILRGEVFLPARTILYGRAGSSGVNGRFTLRFTRMRLPDDTELEFSGIAFDRDDGKPGLAAGRRIESSGPQGESLGTRVAKGAGNVVLSTVSGGVAEDVARTTGQVVLNDQGSSPGSFGGGVILLDAGSLFDVWVERGF